jgi:HEPN domain-containing protein
VPGKDPAHWLHRLDPEEWLAAADNELAQGEEALRRRAARVGVTHARRAAGMALNAILVLEEHPAWGRSYMEHVLALADDPAAPPAARDAARILRDTPPRPPQLVALGRPDLTAIDAGRALVEWARQRVAALALAPQ